MSRPKVKVKRASEDNRNLSTFTILINSNKAVESETFTDRCEKFFDNIYKFVLIREGYSELDDDAEIEVDYDFEVGPSQGRQHCHAVVVIRHNTNVGMSWPKLNAWGKAMGGYFVSSKYVEPSATDQGLQKLKNYTRKDYPKK